MGPRKIVARRAAKELKAGAIINLGVGMPDGIAAVAQEGGYLDQLHFTVEQGIIGGMPMRGIIVTTVEKHYKGQHQRKG